MVRYFNYVYLDSNVKTLKCCLLVRVSINASKSKGTINSMLGKVTSPFYLYVEAFEIDVVYVSCYII